MLERAPSPALAALWSSLPLLASLALAGCGPTTLTSAQMSARAREAMPGCEAGDAVQCAIACAHGGPNAACQRACRADDGPSCVKLAARLEREVDAPDAETPPRPIPPPDPEEVTALYEKACTKGLGEGCRGAGGRILNGQGPGRRSASYALDLLRAGCKQHNDADSCCMMAQLNYRLAEGGAGPNYRDEGKRWAKLAETRGGSCPEPEPVKTFGAGP